MSGDDRWEGGGDVGGRQRSMSSGVLPSIGGGGGGGPAPPPPAATKSRLKPPTQRVMLLPGGLRTLEEKGGGGGGAPSPLKLPMLVKPPRTKVEEALEDKCGGRNQELEEGEEEEGRVAGSGRKGGPRGSIVDKNQDFIRRLEEQKKKEKEEQMKAELRKKKMQKRRAERILEEARQRQAGEFEDPVEPTVVDQPPPAEEPQEDDPADEEERRREAKRQRKRLLKKQQQLLEKLQALKKEKLEEEEQGREKERRRQEKLKKAVLDGIHASREGEAEEVPEELLPHLEEVQADTPPKTVPEEEEVEEVGEKPPKLRKKSKLHKTKKERVEERAEEGTAVTPLEDPPEDKDKPRALDAIQRKQHEYLAKLAEDRRQKLKEEEDARLLQQKKRRRVQLEAQQRLQEAKLLQQQAETVPSAVPSAPPTASPPVDVDAMVARLSKLKPQAAMVLPDARDFASWKKRHAVRADQRVFCLTGWYPVIKQELETRGWVHNPACDPPYFDLFWALKSDDFKGLKLTESQYVNHFTSNTALTTKVGLIHTLRGLTWHQHVDIDSLFPRAYDLNEPVDMENFVMDFRYTLAEGVLKELVKRSSGGEELRINEAVVSVVLAVARKKLQAKRLDTQLEESVDEGSGGEELVTDLEWEVLSRCPVDRPGTFRASLVYKKRVYSEDSKDPSVDSSQPVDTVVSAMEKKLQRQRDKQLQDQFHREKQRLSGLLARVSPLSPSTRGELLRLASKLEEACPQYHLNGGGGGAEMSRNVWIVKPAGLSRGRGIRVFNQLDELLSYADVEHHKECQWVAQKYIENPLLIAKRKFDIRQWVLVTAWDPLTVWVYEDFYLRFSSEEYSTEDLSDQYVHLTNNSIQKYSDKFHEVYATEDGVEIEGNMLHSDEFRAYVAARRGVDAAGFSALHARMKEMIVQSLTCAQDLVQHRKNSCELYGYDFMLDESLRPWLIEVNSSPACDYSTPTAKRYVETGLSGIVKVIVDHREFEARKKSGVTGEKEPDTGRWRRVHKAEYIGKPVSSFGADFQIKGVKVAKAKGRRASGVAVQGPPTKSYVEVPEMEDEEESGEQGEEPAELEVGEDDRDALSIPVVAAGDEDASIDSLL